MRVIRSIIFIFICIGLIWLGIVLIMRAFSGGGNSQTILTQTKLVDLANSDAVAQLYIDGPIIVNQDHVGIRITVDRNSSLIERISGYDDQVVQQQSFPNTAASYAEFLSALDLQSFTKGNNDAKAQDYRGSCPFGNRYVYTLKESGGELYHYWTTSCGGGTFGGQRNNTRILFTRQVPDKVLNDLLKNFNP